MGLAVLSLARESTAERSRGPASGAGTDGTDIQSVHEVDALVILPFPALARAASAWGISAADASRAVALATDGVELHMLCPRTPASAADAPDMSTAEKVSPVVLQLDLASGEPFTQATARRLVAAGGDASRLGAEGVPIETNLLVGNAPNASRPPAMMSRGAARLTGKTLLGSKAGCSEGKLLWKVRVLAGVSTNAAANLVLGAARGDLRSAKPDDSANYACLLLAANGSVRLSAAAHVSADHRYMVLPGETLSFELDLGSADCRTATLRVTSDRTGIRVLASSLVTHEH